MTMVNSGQLTYLAGTQNLTAPARNSRVYNQTNPTWNSESASGEKPRATRGSLVKPLLVFSVSMLAIALLLYSLAVLFGEGISRGGHSASQKRLEIVIANTVLNVPSNHVRFASQRRFGNQNRLELYAHWPDFSGYSDQLKSAFSHTDRHESLIFMSLEPRTISLDMSGRIKPIYAKFFDGPSYRAQAGLARQPLSPEGGFIDEDLYYELESPYPYVTRCVRPGSTIATPFCIRDIHIGKDLMLTYRFHIKHLPSWIEIESKVKNFINRLMVNADNSIYN